MYGSWIRAARERTGKTLKDAATESGLSVDGLSKIERNINGASMATLEKLANTYHCVIGDLLPNSVSNREVTELEPLVTAALALRPESRMEMVAALLPQIRLMARLLGGEIDLSMGRKLPAAVTPTVDEPITTTREDRATMPTREQLKVFRKAQGTANVEKAGKRTSSPRGKRKAVPDRSESRIRNKN